MTIQLLPADGNGPTPQVYFASSISTYRTPRYDVMLTAAQRLFPDAAIVPARGLYTCTSDWLARWPREAPSYAAGIFFADADGCIGRGVWREIHDLRQLGRLVYFLDDAGALHPFEIVQLDTIEDGASWRRYASVSLIAPPDEGGADAEPNNEPAWFSPSSETALLSPSLASYAAFHSPLPAVFAAEALALGQRGHRATSDLVKREAQLRRAKRHRERQDVQRCERCSGWPALRYAPLTSFMPHVLLCFPCCDEHERSTGVQLRRIPLSAVR